MNGIDDSVGDTNLLVQNLSLAMNGYDYDEMHHICLVSYSVHDCIFRSLTTRIDNEPRTKGSFVNVIFVVDVVVLHLFSITFSFSCSIMAHSNRINWFHFFYSSFVLALIVFLFLFGSVFAIVNSQHIFHCVCLYMCVKYFNIKFVSHFECILTVQFNTSK